MGLVLAGADPIVVVDRVPAKLALAQELGATHAIQAGPDDAATRNAIRAATGGGPDYRVRGHRPAGRRSSSRSAACQPGGTATLVGMTPFGEQASFEVFPFVDGGRRILGSNYGSAVPAVDFPRYAQLHLDGRLPIERLIERRIGLDDVEDAFDRHAPRARGCAAWSPSTDGPTCRVRPPRRGPPGPRRGGPPAPGTASS